jgi:diacylglycerol kinase (ATP)
MIQFSGPSRPSQTMQADRGCGVCSGVRLLNLVSLGLMRDDELTTPAVSRATRPFEFTGRVRSFRYAVAGILRMIRCQHNAWIHAAATLLVLAAAVVLRVSAADWCWIILAISIVWTAEALNTAFEFLADAASPEFHPLVRDAKDVAAGAVLITTIAAATIGVIILWPYVARLMS